MSEYLLLFPDWSDRKQLYRDALDKWGALAQVGQTQEEAAELISILNKFWRGRATESEILDEITDMTIMLEQMLVFFDFSVADLERHRDMKLERLSRMLNMEAGS